MPSPEETSIPVEYLTTARLGQKRADHVTQSVPRHGSP